MSTLQQVGKRIESYCRDNKISRFNINFHGGEPLMFGSQRLNEAIEVLKESMAGIRINFGLQTNATLVDDAFIKVFQLNKVAIGASLDGGVFSNRFRIDHKGKDSWERATTGIKKLSESKTLAGLQAVIDLDSDPVEVINVLSDFNPKIIELGQPFANYANPPNDDTKYNLGDWLIKAFDYWINNPRLVNIRIPVLEDAMVSILTERSSSDWFPALPPGYLVVATDGSFEGLDTLKVAGVAGRLTSLIAENDYISDALNHPSIKNRAEGNLCRECSKCEIKNWCHGGYYPTRYSSTNEFDNPSIYCSDLKHLFQHIAKYLLKSSSIDTEKKSDIKERLRCLKIAGGEKC